MSAQDNASFVAAASTPAELKTLIEQSPLNYDYIPEHNDTIRGWDDRSRIAALVEPIQSTAAITSPSGDTVTTGRKRFTAHIFPSPYYKHRQAIQYSPLYGAWPVKESERARDTFVYNALRATVPNDMAAPGLADWQTGGQLTEERRKMRAQVPDLTQYQEADRKMRILNRLQERKKQPNLEIVSSSTKTTTGETDVKSKAWPEATTAPLDPKQQQPTSHLRRQVLQIMENNGKMHHPEHKPQPSSQHATTEQKMAAGQDVSAWDLFEIQVRSESHRRVPNDKKLQSTLSTKPVGHTTSAAQTKSAWSGFEELAQSPTNQTAWKPRPKVRTKV